MSEIFPTLFTPLILRGQVPKNRIFSTGHLTVMLQDGLPTDAMVAYHSAGAEGGAALIYSTWKISCERSLNRGTLSQGR